MKLDSCYGSVHQRHLYFTVQRAHCSHSDSTDTIEIEFTVCQCRHDCQLPAYKGILSHAAWPDMSICPSFSQHLTYRSNRRQTKGYWVMQPDQTCQSARLSANIWLTGQTEDRDHTIFGVSNLTQAEQKISQVADSQSDIKSTLLLNDEAMVVWSADCPP